MKNHFRDFFLATVGQDSNFTSYREYYKFLAKEEKKTKVRKEHKHDKNSFIV